MSSNNQIQWGVLACGRIAAKFAQALNETPGSELYGVASRDASKAEAFAKEHQAKVAYESYEALLADPQVEVVYIATLHPFHFEWIVKSVRAGKHVLCEKPLTMNFRQAKQAYTVAKENRRLLREGFMYRHHPQTKQVVDLVSSGAIGSVRMIESNFCFEMGEQPESRLQSKPLGGGAILDLGCYPVSFLRLIAGRANDLPFAEPLELKAVGHIDPSLLTDMWTSAVMRFEGDILGRATVAMRVEGGRHSTVFGEKGRITIDASWHCNGSIRVDRDGEPTPRVYPADTSRALFTYEIESFVGELRGRPIAAEEAAMRLDDTLGNMKALDRWRSEIGLAYEADRTS
ncbi:MAG: Gfo/Idh/MocA family oxidoreductase [Verrucomicrobiota bacterium]